ncbi:hypothetical protein J437_LFUL003787 [Ladona fulva]|uniref:Uncharacterized protein n=1 Tax=Ladona fulva TaxID=123851 RepID=A0A8K0NS46_LADFU|nr:hypothetical protein J437_LFUL003787 [Ladona fulva]
MNSYGKTERACGSIKANFQKEVPGVVTVHWAGKLLPALDARTSKEERLPIVILYLNKEQLIAVPSDQFKITSKDKAALLEVCLFIVSSYVKPWIQCILAVKAPYQDLFFLKSMKAYEKSDKSIAKAALQKIIQHLWYMNDEVFVLSLFDDDVDQETKVKMVENLTKENLSTHGKRYIPSKEELRGPLYDK